MTLSVTLILATVFVFAAAVTKDSGYKEIEEFLKKNLGKYRNPDVDRDNHLIAYLKEKHIVFDGKIFWYGHQSKFFASANGSNFIKINHLMPTGANSQELEQEEHATGAVKGITFFLMKSGTGFTINADNQFDFNVSLKNGVLQIVEGEKPKDAKKAKLIVDWINKIVKMTEVTPLEKPSK